MQQRRYPYEAKGGPKRPRAIERELPDQAVLDEIEAARGNPERASWLRKLRVEKKRRGI